MAKKRGSGSGARNAVGGRAGTAGPPRSPSPEIGVSGLRRSGGYVQEEFLKDLRGPRAMKIYREMRDNSAVIGAGLGAIEMLLRQVEWHVEPKSEDREDKRYAEHVESCRDDMSHTWSELIGEALTMLPFGFAYHELVYKRRVGDVNDPMQRSKHNDGLIGWRKIPLRGQESLFDWEFDPGGGIQAMRQMAAPDYTLRRISIEKALLFRARSEKNNPEGRSVLRNAYFSWYFAKRICEIEGIGIERDLAGFPVMGIPAACMLEDASPQQRQTYEMAKELVTSLKRDEAEGAVIPLEYLPGTSNKLYELTLLSTGGRRQFDTSQIVERYERRILMVMLADFIIMGHENVGSFALSSDKTALFAVACAGWLDVIRDIFNLHAIPRLMRMNGWPADQSPKLVHGDLEAQNLAALGDYIAKLSGAGMELFPDEALENHLRRVGGLPRRSKAAQVLGPDGKPATAAAKRRPEPKEPEEDAA